MSKWRKKPVVIDAFRWTGGPDQTEEPEWIVEALKKDPALPGGAWVTPEPRGILGIYMEIHTLEGIITAKPGDYIIRGVQGEIYPCKPDIFEATYEPAEADDDDA